MKGMCFTCYDHMQFQIFGTLNHTDSYMDHVNIEKEIISCDLCDRTVKYEKQNDKWEEVELEVCSKCGINLLPMDSPYYHCESCRK